MRRSKNLALTAAVAVALAGLCGGAIAGGAMSKAWAQTPSNPDEIIAARQEGFKHVGEEFGAMKKGIDAGADVQQFAAGANDIAAWGKKAPGLFPPGTETGHKTHATAAVWSDKTTFDKNAADMSTEAAKLSTVAASGDKAAFAAQWKATGATCGSCHAHEKFRTRID